VLVILGGAFEPLSVVRIGAEGRTHWVANLPPGVFEALPASVDGRMLVATQNARVEVHQLSVVGLFSQSWDIAPTQILPHFTGRVVHLIDAHGDVGWHSLYIMYDPPPGPGTMLIAFRPDHDPLAFGLPGKYLPFVPITRNILLGRGLQSGPSKLYLLEVPSWSEATPLREVLPGV
jgi:hypothetical protein